MAFSLPRYLIIIAKLAKGVAGAACDTSFCSRKCAMPIELSLVGRQHLSDRMS
jgi:hypothetical protein